MILKTAITAILFASGVARAETLQVHPHNNAVEILAKIEKNSLSQHCLAAFEFDAFTSDDGEEKDLAEQTRRDQQVKTYLTAGKLQERADRHIMVTPELETKCNAVAEYRMSEVAAVINDLKADLASGKLSSEQLKNWINSGMMKMLPQDWKLRKSLDK